MKIKKVTISDIQDEKPAEKAKIQTEVITETPPKRKGLSLNSTQKVIIGFGSILLLLSLLFIYSIFAYGPKRPPKLIRFAGDYIVAEELEQIRPLSAASKPSEPRTYVNPINGTLHTKSEYEKFTSRLPVAVMTNNHVAARPLSNITEADIVFETLVEGGITRVMPIFWSREVNKVGPIRSARQQYIEWLSPYDALYIHDGYASSDDPRVDAGGNIYRYKIKDISTIGAWRSNEGGRVSPHNEYSSPVAAWNHAKTKGWTTLPSTLTPLQFKKDEPVNPTEVSGARIKFHQRLANGGLYDVEWTYNSTTNGYDRKIGGKVDIDNESGGIISPKSVIIQDVKTIPTGDEKGHLIVEVIGKGNAKILMDGKVVLGTWEKKSRTERTRYYDNNGKEIVFNRGQIWICAVSTTDGKIDLL